MAASMRNVCRRFLIHLAHDHLEFRIPELKAVSQFLDIDVHISEDYDQKSPYVEIELPSEEDAKKLIARTFLARSVYELWGKGTTFEDLITELKTLPPDLVSRYANPEVSFKIVVDTFNKQITQKQKIKKIEDVLGAVDSLAGRIDLSHPQQVFQLSEFYEWEKNTSAERPSRIYFGRWIADSQRNTVRNFNLQDRKFIANTSMDPELSLVMANMGAVTKNSLVLDPFVGSGSLLVACAHFGAYVMGTEIDYNLMHAIGKASRKGQKWRKKDESIRNNLKQYGLEQYYIDALVADASRDQLWRSDMPLFDAIITDPPYGIRETSMKLGCEKDDPSVPEECKEGHIPPKTKYQLNTLFTDLLNFAARTLRLGGRLVYWLPVGRGKHEENRVPEHPCLKLLANSEQPLNTKVGRRLITMVKVLEHQDTEGTATLSGNLYKESGFRDLYFQPSEKNKNRGQRSRSRSPLGCTDEPKPSAGATDTCDTSEKCEETGLTHSSSAQKSPCGDKQDSHLTASPQQPSDSKSVPMMEDQSDSEKVTKAHS